MELNANAVIEALRLQLEQARFQLTVTQLANEALTSQVVELQAHIAELESAEEWVE